MIIYKVQSTYLEFELSVYIEKEKTNPPKSFMFL